MDIAVRVRLVLLGLIIATMPARADLKLEPQASTYQVEGITFSHIIFRDGEKTVSYVPPKGWKYRGSETTLRLWPNGVTQAEATVTRFPLPEKTAFDEGNRGALVEKAIAALPPESSNVQVVNQELNPVQIGKNGTFLVTISFTSHGDDLTRSVMFLNREQDQIQFQLSTRTPDFPKLQEAFRKSHFSWHGL